MSINALQSLQKNRSVFKWIRIKISNYCSNQVTIFLILLKIKFSYKHFEGSVERIIII